MPSSPAHACLPDPSEVPHGAADCWDGGCGVVSGEPSFKPGWILKTLRWNEAGSLGGISDIPHGRKRAMTEWKKGNRPQKAPVFLPEQVWTLASLKGAAQLGMGC